LIHHFLRIAIGRYDDVNVIRARVHRVQEPPTDVARVANALLDDAPLFCSEHHGRLHNALARVLSCSRTGSDGSMPYSPHLTQPSASPGSHVPWVVQVMWQAITDDMAASRPCSPRRQVGV
jgi:hypothetical protein